MIVVSAPARRRLAALGAILASSLLTTCRLDDLLSPGEFGTLAVAPAGLEDSARVGSRALKTLMADLEIEGPGTLLPFRVRAELNSAWLTLSDTQGTAPGSYSVDFDPAGLAVGDYLDTLRFTSEGPEAEPARIPVRFRVLPCEVTVLTAVPSSVTAGLTDADCASALHPDRHARRYRFAGTGGDSITARLTTTGMGASVSLWLDGAATPLAANSTCAAAGSGACVRYVLLPSTGNYVVEVTSGTARETGVFTLTVGRPRVPDPVTTLEQRGSGGAVLAVGAAHAEKLVVLRGILGDQDLDSLRFEVEVRPIGISFLGTATAASAMGSDPQFEVTNVGLLDDASYQWQARAVDVTGRASAWVAFGGNATGATDFAVSVPEAPTAPVALTQRRGDGVTVIAAGGTTGETLVRLGATLTDPDPSDAVRLEVELRPTGTPFNGIASASSALVASGTAALVTVAGLTDDVQYRWQARAVDGTGRASAWSSFGLSGADFRTALPPVQLAMIVGPADVPAGSAITPAVRVAAQDASGNTLTSFSGNVTIALGANPTSDVLDGTTTVAAVNGVASFIDLSLDRSSAGYTLVASASGLAVTSAPFTVRAAAAQSLAIGALPSSLTAGTTVAPGIVVTVLDAFGNVASNFSGTVSLGLAPNGAGAALLGTLSVNATSGVAQFNNVRIERAATGVTLVASATGLPNMVSPAFAVTAAAPAALRLVTAPSTVAVSGTAFAPQPVIAVEDAFGNAVLVSGTSITATVTAGPAGSALTGAAAATGSGGVATFTGLTLTGVAGTYSIAFSSSGLSAITVGGITIGVGAASRLILVTAPSSSAASGVAIQQQPVVQLRDVAGNNVAQGGVSVAASIESGGGSITGTTTVLTSAGGSAIFTDLALTGLAGPRTLAFAATGLVGVSSGTIQLGAGPATQIALEAGSGQTATAGSPIAIAPAVRVRDASSNPVAGVTVRFSVTAGGGAIAPTTDLITGSTGIAALTSWTLGPVVGANALSASSNGLAGSPVTFSATGTAGVASLLQITGGQSLTAPVGSTLGTAHEVRVTDANGNPVVGIAVVWTVGGGGSVNPANSVTDAAGRAATVRTLGPTPGTQTTSAAVTLAGGPTTANFTILATVGGASQMALSAGDAQADTVGATLATPLAVVVRDALNNPVSGVLITWSVVDGGGSVLPTTSLTNALGIATTAWTLGTVTTPTDSTQLARASGVGSPINFIATSRTGAVSGLQTLVAISPSTVAASRNTPVTVTVTARDGFGNPIPGRSATLSATGSGNTITQPSSTTAANGVTTGAIGALASGARTVSATVDGILAAQQPTLTVVAAPAERLLFTVQPTSAVAGAALSPIPELGAVDSLGNRSATFAGTVTLAFATNPAGGTLSGTLTRNAVAGVVSFPGISVNRSGAGYSLAAASSGLTGVSSTSFDVTVGAASAVQSVLTPATASLTANGTTTQVLSVQARDANGNALTTGGAEVAITRQSGTGTVGVVTDVGNGTYVATVTAPTVAGGGVFIASLGGAAVQGGGGTQTQATLTYVPGAANAVQSTLTPTTAAIVANGTATQVLTVQARDANGNALTTGGATVTITRQSGTGTVGAVSNVGNGAYTATVTAPTTVGSGVFIATLGGAAVQSGGGAQTQATMSYVAGAATQLALTTSAAGAASGTAFTTQPVVAIRDVNNNLVSTNNTTVVTMTVSAGATVVGTAAVTASSGVATFATVGLSGTAASYTLTFSSSPALTVATQPITVTAGAANAVQSTLTPTTAAIVANGTATQVLTVQARDANGNALTTGGATVTITRQSGTGTVGAVSNVGNGTYTATVTAPTTVGSGVFIATLGGAAVQGGGGAQTQATMSYVAGAATRLAITTPAAGAASGAAFTTQPVVAIRDVNNNLVSTNNTTVVTMTVTAGATVVGTAAVTASSGVATFTTVGASGLAATYTLTFSSSPALTVATQPITLTAGAANAVQSTLTPTTASLTANGTATQVLTVQARDANGNALTTGGATVTVTQQSGTGTIGAVADVGNGTYTATVTAPTAVGTGVFVATLGGAAVQSGGGAQTQATLTYGPGAASAVQSTLTPTSVSLTANGTATQVLTVQARDAQGNALTTGSATVTITQQSGTGTIGVVTDVGNGTYTATVTAPTAVGSGVFIATLGGAAVQSGGGAQTQATVSYVAGPATQLALTTSAAGAASGAAFTTQPVVAIRDANGNLVTTDNATVVTMAVSAGATVVGTATATASSGVATFATVGVSGVATGYTLTFSSAPVLTVTTQPITITAGAANAVQSTLTPTSASLTANGTATQVLTVQARDANGNALTTGGATVTITQLSGTGTIGGVTDNTDGTYTATVTAPTAVGTGVFIATLGGAAVQSGGGVQTQATVSYVAGTATQLGLTTSAAGASSGAAFTTQPVVAIRDATGNLVTTDNATIVTMAVSAGATVVGTATTTASSGVATFTTVGLSGLTATYTVSFSSAPVLAAATQSIALTAGAATQLALTTSAAGATSGTAFTTQPVVAIRDANGNLVTTDNATVVTMTVSEAATVVGTATATAANGVATFTTVGLSGTSATYTLTFNSAPVLTAATQSIALAAGAATQLALTTTAAGALSGAAFTTQPVVAIRDANGNAVTTDSTTVVTMAVSAGATVVGTATATASSGVAAFSTTGLSGAPATYTLTFSSAPVLTVATQSIALAVGAASAVQSTLSPPTASLTANGTATQVLTVQARDANGNALTTGGATVTITQQSGTGTISVVTDAGNGTYTATVTSPTAVGSGVFVATLGGAAVQSGGGTPTQATLTYVPGAATQLALSTSAAGASSGAAFTTQPVVAIRDASGNLVPTDNATAVTMTVSAGATVIGTSTATASSGVATFTTVGVSGLAATYTLTFSSAPVLTEVAQSIALTAGAANAVQSTLTPTSASLTANGAATQVLTVQARDAQGNALTSGGVTVTITQQSGTGTIGAVTDNLNGTYTATVTAPTSVGSGVFVATLGGAAVQSGGGAQTQATLTFVPDAANAAQSTLTPTSVSLTANGTATQVLTVQARDAQGNALTSGGATVTITQQSGTGTIGAVTDNLNGTYTATVTAPTAIGSGVFVATLGGAAVQSGGGAQTQSTVSYVAGTATQLVLTTSAAGASSGAAFTTQPVVAIRDANGNLVTTDNATVVTMAVSAGAAVIGTSSATASSGVATFTTVGVSGLAATYTLTFSSAPVFAEATQSVALTAGAANAVQSTLTPTSASLTANGTATQVLTVQARDANGNALTTGGATVTITQQSGTGTIGVVTDVGNGTYTATVTAPTAVGSGVFIATLGGAAVQGGGGAQTQATVSYVAGPATQLALTTSAAGAASGAAFTTQPVVAIRDANANLVATDNTTVVTMAVSAGGTVVGTATATASSGVATFATVGVSGVATGYTLTFSSAPVLTVTTQPITVTAGAANAVQSTLTPTSASLTANGTATQVLTVQARDANGNALTTGGATVAITQQSGTGTISGVTDNTDGTYTATVTAPTAVGSGVFVATLGGAAVQGGGGTQTTAALNYTVGGANAVQSTLTPTSANLTANGTATQVLTVQARDANGNALTTGGATVAITQQSGTGTIGGVTDNTDGTYTATVTAPTAVGTGVFMATLGGAAVQSGTGAQTQATLTYVAGAATQLALTTPAAGAASGAAFTTQPVVAIRDATGNLVSTDNTTVVTMTVSAGATVVGTAAATAASGVATFTTVGVTGLAATYTLTFSSAPVLTAATQSIAVTAGAANAVQSSLTPTSASLTANGTATQVLTVQARDAQGNTLTTGGATVTITQQSGTGTIGVVADVGNGTYTATVTAPTAVGSGVFVATLGGAAVQSGAGTQTQATLTYVPGPADLTTSTVGASPASITADGVATATITVQLKDLNGNDLTGSGGTVELATDAGALSVVVDNLDGTYTATLTSAVTPGTATITATLNGAALTSGTTVEFVALLVGGLVLEKEPEFTLSRYHSTDRIPPHRPSLVHG